MSSARAYTRLEAGAAVIGNPWAERRWSRFMGHTVELRAQAGAFDWLTGKCAEIAVQIGGKWLGLPELGAVEWAEEPHSLGAALLARYGGGTIAVLVRTDAFHRSAGLLRRVTLVNTTPEAMLITAVVLDALALRHDDVVVRTEHLERADIARVWETHERVAAVMRGHRGLLLMLEGGGRFELFSPELGACRLLRVEAKTLAPGQRWPLPDCGILPFDGNWEEASSRTLGEFLVQVRHLKKWEAEQVVRAGQEE